MAQSYNSLIAKNTDTQQHGGSRTTLSPKVLIIILILSNSYLLNTLSIILKKIIHIYIFTANFSFWSRELFSNHIWTYINIKGGHSIFWGQNCINLLHWQIIKATACHTELINAILDTHRQIKPCPQNSSNIQVNKYKINYQQKKCDWRQSSIKISIHKWA